MRGKVRYLQRHGSGKKLLAEFAREYLLVWKLILCEDEKLWFFQYRFIQLSLSQIQQMRIVLFFSLVIPLIIYLFKNEYNFFCLPYFVNMHFVNSRSGILGPYLDTEPGTSLIDI